MRCNAVGLFVCCCLVICNVIDGISGDRGSFIGCYRQNLYLARLNIFSGSVDECVNACAQQYNRFGFSDVQKNSCLFQLISANFPNLRLFSKISQICRPRWQRMLLHKHNQGDRSERRRVR